MSNFQQQDYVTLTKSHLFRKKTPEQVKELLQAITSFVKQYNKGDLVVSNYDQAHYLGIILEGKLNVQKIQANGKSTTLAQLGVAQLIGEAVLFSDEKTYPSTIYAAEFCRVLFIPKEELVRLFILDNPTTISFIESLSNRILFLNKRIESLSLGTIRQKIAHYLLDEEKKQRSLTIKLPFSRQVWADHLSIPRPSLSRELIFLRDQGWISFSGKEIIIKDKTALEDLLS